jgi:endonuclease/exonuclease/phosphatase family metal-dependent hydrolase
MSANNIKTKGLIWKRILMGLFIPLVLIIMQACGTSNKLPEGARIIEDTPTRSIPTTTPYVTPTIPSADFLTATASALQSHEGAVRFMSYNINNGGQDRLPLITSILQAYNPDVLAIQETNGWQLDDFAIAKQVASDLGMEYVYCQSTAADENGNTFDAVLMSKLEIKNSETYADVQNCLIRAEVLTADGQSVQVFATQIAPNFDETACKNVENIVKAIQPFAGDAAILIGDMTMPPPSILLGYPQSQIVCPPLLEAAGFTFFSDVSRIDHIWATQGLLAKQSYKLPNPNKEPLVPKNTLRNASDHSPLAADFYFP